MQTPFNSSRLVACARASGSAGSAYNAADLAPATGTYVGCMFWDYMSVLRVALQQKHSGPVMTGATDAAGRIE